MENPEIIGSVPPEVAVAARHVAREEIASLCGLVLRRLQDTDIRDSVLDPDPLAPIRSVFAEALRDFGGTSGEPGADA